MNISLYVRAGSGFDGRVRSTRSYRQNEKVDFSGFGPNPSGDTTAWRVFFCSGHGLCALNPAWETRQGWAVNRSSRHRGGSGHSWPQTRQSTGFGEDGRGSNPALRQPRFAVMAGSIQGVEEPSSERQACASRYLNVIESALVQRRVAGPDSPIDETKLRQAKNRMPAALQAQSVVSSPTALKRAGIVRRSLEWHPERASQSGLQLSKSGELSKPKSTASAVVRRAFARLPWYPFPFMVLFNQ